MSIPAWWGQVPPPAPYFGQSWLDTSRGLAAAKLWVFDGDDWNFAATWDTGSTFTANPAASPGVGTIASATTTDLTTVSQSVVVVTGTTTITHLGVPAASQVNVQKALLFGGALTFTHGAGLILLPGATNKTTAIGDVAVMRWTGAAWELVVYQTAAF